MKMREKLTKILELLDKKLVERDDENRMILLGMLSGQNIIILGPPGTAKSLAARTFCNLISGGKFFEYLLTKFTQPDEIFGPIDVNKLMEGKYTRLIENYLPEAHIAFLDEIFKSSSSILNTLLTIMNERKFHIGNMIIQVPLITIIGASNELPAEDEESLDALYDRFIIRLSVENVKNEENFKKIVVENCDQLDINMTLTIDDIKEIQSKAKFISIPESIFHILISIKSKLKEMNIEISDRRWQKIFYILKVSAFTNGRNEIDESDLLSLKFLLNDNIEQIHMIKQILRDALTEGIRGGKEIRHYLEDFHKGELTEFALYNTDEEKLLAKKFYFGDKENYSELIKKSTVDSLNNFLKDIDENYTFLNERRNNLEDRTTTNLWVKWINLSEFIEPIDKEISLLNELKDDIRNLINHFKGGFHDYIQFDCPKCKSEKSVRLKKEKYDSQNFSEVSCEKCNMKYLI